MISLSETSHEIFRRRVTIDRLKELAKNTEDVRGCFSDEISFHEGKIASLLREAHMEFEQSFFIGDKVKRKKQDVIYTVTRVDWFEYDFESLLRPRYFLKELSRFIKDSEPFYLHERTTITSTSQTKI